MREIQINYLHALAWLQNKEPLLEKHNMSMHTFPNKVK